jgi:uncharacterized membrane protein
MPALSNEGVYVHMDYHVLGTNFSEVIQNMIKEPLYTFKLLFFNYSGNLKADFVKAELHVFVLLSGGILLFLKPQFFIMLIPIYFQKLFHDNFGMWGIGGQYSVEFAPILIIGSVCVIKNFGNEKIRKTIMLTMLLLIIAVTIRSFDRTYSYFDRDKQRVYQAPHWTNNFDVQQTYKALDIIPTDASVSAQSPFVPHLAGREHIYQYPIIKDATFIILSVIDSPYPLSSNDYENKFAELVNSKSWIIIYNLPPILIFKHINSK